MNKNIVMGPNRIEGGGSAAQLPSVVRQKNMFMGPVGSTTKNNSRTTSNLHDQLTEKYSLGSCKT
jgi:hypothetical protein